MVQLLHESIINELQFATNVLIFLPAALVRHYGFMTNGSGELSKTTNIGLKLDINVTHNYL